MGDWLFTGIVQEVGRVASVTRKSASMRLKIECARVRKDAGLGDSISVNGACLTVSELGAGWVEMDVGEETFTRTTLGALKSGASINLEAALRVGQSVGGHIVTGHIDATALVRSVTKQATQTVMNVELPPSLRPLVASKGSVAVDGISLTVGQVHDAWFSLYLIPHTLKNTTLLDRKPGHAVNLEADILARYVYNALCASENKSDTGLYDLLQKFGYTKS